MQEKTITIKVTEEQHRKIKVESALCGMTVKDYLLGLVEKDLDSKKKPDTLDK